MIFSLLSSASCQTRCHDQLWSDSSKSISISTLNHAKEPGDTSLGLLKSDWMQAGKNLGIPGKNHLSQVELGKGLQSGPGGKNKKNSNHEPRTRELNETSKLVTMKWNE